MGSLSSSPITDQVRNPRGLTRWSSLEQSSPLAESLRASWSLVCKTCEEKHWIWDSTKEHPAVLSLEAAHCVPSRPWRCWPLPSLTNVQTTVQRHCPEQVVWTLGRRSRISWSFHRCVENPVPGLGRACLPAPGACSASPLNPVCCIDWDTLKGCDFQSWRGTFAAD
jgi:hypothetical protein